MKNGLSLFEESFCQLVALGKTGREAYSEAYGKTPKSPGAFDRKISYLTKRPEIITRIDEIRVEAKRRNAALWQQRGEQLAELVFNGVLHKSTHSNTSILDRDALHGIEVLAKLKGLNAPEEHTLRNGGVTDDYNAPRALQEMSDEQLARVIAEAGQSGSSAEEATNREDERGPDEQSN